MPYLIIVVVLIIIAVTIIKSILPIVKRKKLIEKLENYLKKAKISHEFKTLNNDIYDIDLKINDNKYVIKIVIVPEYSEIQINSKETWEVKYGAGNTPGKVQPHKRYLNEISTFQKTSFPNGEIKLILFSPKPKKIVKYINECEIVFVNPSTDVYGSRIINEDNFGIFFK